MLAGISLMLASIVVGVAAQRGGAPPLPQAAQGGGRGGTRGGNVPTPGVGNPNATFPAQQRPAGDPALIARGNGLYGANCRLCHGADLRGGEQGGPNLLRSAVVFDDQSGELIAPVVLNGRNNPGMPPMPKITLPADDIKAIAEYIHSIVATSQGQGAPPRGAPVQLNVLVGDAKAGEAYFAKTCSSCHSVTGDLAGLGTRLANPTQLQNAWLGGNAGGGGRGGGRGGGAANPVTVTVTPPNGPKVEGVRERLDDFMVVLTLADGSQRSFRRDGDVPRVEVHDPAEAHRKLLPGYTDKDIHDVTAYLVNVK
ncbi:MAG TPA: c-type cytochrome [Terriglobia bacterium]|nr:c-type cytochrome [Terriglobia bacterium]